MHCPKNNLIFRVKPSMSYQGVSETVNVWFLGLKCAQKLDICVMCMYCTVYIVFQSRQVFVRQVIFGTVHAHWGWKEAAQAPQ